jgi:hypothetical protein
MKSSVSEGLSASVKTILGTAVLAAFLATSVNAENDDNDSDADSFPKVQKNLKNLRQRVRALESEVAALQSRHLPVEASVDCASGGTINEALATHANGEGLLTIRVAGTCTEAVRVSRSNVLVQGQGESTVLQAPAGALFTFIADSNVSNVTLSDVTATGGTTAAVIAHHGAHLTVKNAVVRNAASGVIALDTGLVDVHTSSLRNNSQGAYAARNGVVSISNSTLESNVVGALAFKAGTIILTSTTPDYSPGIAGPIVQNNTNGVVARSGGFIELADTTIQNNSANGVVADTGGTVHFFSRLIGPGNRIAGSGQNGVVATRNANLVFQDNTNVITGNLRGVLCVNNPAYLVPVGFVVTGNTAGDIINCVP